MTHMLMRSCEPAPAVVIVLEGGYNLNIIPFCAQGGRLARCSNGHRSVQIAIRVCLHSVHDGPAGKPRCRQAPH
jgi:hypothetical protein